VKLRDYLAEHLPSVPRSLLPSHAKLLGHVALLRLRSEIEDHKLEVGDLARKFYRVRAVYMIRGIEGVERRPVLELLSGEPINEVVHREYGCAFKLNITKLMFCLGNSFERLRLAGCVSRGEVIIDMFAGVGQFTIPMAVLSDPKKIYAVEINQEAYNYLLENIRLNEVENKVHPILGDCKKVVGEQLEEVADRVVMGCFWGTLKALPAALKSLRQEGGVIHFHELARRGLEEEFSKKVLETAKHLGYKVQLLGWRRVKSYSRTQNHVVIDFFAIKH